ncbi:MAG: hypothetical protein ABH889_02235 [Candidatus Portnoybacteria bacterium]
MEKKDLDLIEEKAKEKAQKREKKKKPKMQVSGKGVFKLRELIRKNPNIKSGSRPRSASGKSKP